MLLLLPWMLINSHPFPMAMSLPPSMKQPKYCVRLRQMVEKENSRNCSHQPLSLLLRYLGHNNELIMGHWHFVANKDDFKDSNGGWACAALFQIKKWDSASFSYSYVPTLELCSVVFCLNLIIWLSIYGGNVFLFLKIQNIFTVSLCYTSFLFTLPHSIYTHNLN